MTFAYSMLFAYQAACLAVAVLTVAVVGQLLRAAVRVVRR